MHSIRVRTTQNVFIHYPIASIGDRILGYLLDRLILILYTILIVVLFLNLKIAAYWIWGMVIGTPWLLYSVLFEIFMEGQSPGKKVMDIRVVRLDGTPPRISDYLMRWVFSFIDFYVLSGAIAVVIIAVGGKGQRLGDLVAGTSVVKLIAQKEISSSQVFVTTDEAYTPTFFQVIHLNEKDVDLIQKALEVNRDQGNGAPMMAITEKIKTLLGVETDLPPIKFLYTVIKDYNHLAGR